MSVDAKTYAKDGTTTGQTPLDPACFEIPVNDHILYEYVKTYQGNQRQGTAKTKGRSEVSGGGAKPWRQKGTGRARAGTNTSPLWIRGGKAHGPSPRSYYSRFPKKKRRNAMLSALSARAGDGAVRIIDSLNLESPKTRQMAELLKTMELHNLYNLFVVTECEQNLLLSVRNMRSASVVRLADLNPYDVLNCDNLVFTHDAINNLKTKLQPNKAGE